MTHTTKLFVQSFVIVPLVATTLSMNAFTASINDAVIKATSAETTLSPEAQKLQADREEKAAKIDAYYAQYDLPLAGHGMHMVLVAEEHDLDWRLLPAIAMRESTGCKFIIKSNNNCFGWGSGKIKFKDFDEAIDTVGSHLGGENPRTSRYYDGKDTLGILKSYNSVIPTYSKEILSIMSKIEKTEA
jgi:hypothetical protein